jgi:hypothetical protein
LKGLGDGTRLGDFQPMMVIKTLVSTTTLWAIEEGTLVIRSMTGNIIYGPHPFNGSEQIDLSNISKGIYIATVKCQKNPIPGK